jgi:pimeloyl-ACP methyl ester carboxylesterase
MEASAISDLAMRTGLATAVAAFAAPWVVTRSARKERGRLGFYRELAEQPDARKVFPQPPSIDAISRKRATGRLSFAAPAGQVEMLRFDSPFVAVNPDLRIEYGRFKRNRVAWAQHWRHNDGPRPTLCVIHGFAGSPYWFNSVFFALPWLYSRGYDVLLYTMPFHGPRTGFTPLDGSELFAHGPAHFNEAITHAVHDFRVFVDYLKRSGVEQIALTGLSLGGYMSALLAAVEDRLDVVIPNAAVVDFPALVRRWFPANLGLWMGMLWAGIPADEMSRALVFHSPLHYHPCIPRSRLMIIGGLGDRLAPPDQSRLLWEHWGRPRLHWYPGSHILHFERSAYLRELPRFMQAAGFNADPGRASA